MLLELRITFAVARRWSDALRFPWRTFLTTWRWEFFKRGCHVSCCWLCSYPLRWLSFQGFDHILSPEKWHEYPTGLDMLRYWFSYGLEFGISMNISIYQPYFPVRLPIWGRLLWIWGSLDDALGKRLALWFRLPNFQSSSGAFGERAAHLDLCCLKGHFSGRSFQCGWIQRHCFCSCGARTSQHTKLVPRSSRLSFSLYYCFVYVWMFLYVFVVYI